MNSAAHTVKINFRTDADTKAQAEELFRVLGLDISTALNMFLKQAIREQGLPIQPALHRIPNEITRKAIAHTEAILAGEIDDDGIPYDPERGIDALLDD
ncbi:type II toxin-antitoxin system RelB/DinJ family antitoxin [Corynebacterium lizhenjunii]|uniref:Type II toxin-antitoxin system RelB/DinJ family antitoxin n=1 Tax=Corynebacterium lizhenjunii TaxID=2709394 RepID=A0A7T0KDV0_9CORY|nr:type II toxin-antitoxin system RelB/DinJ family antitoxin [Corynebacterium lizhenjunii]QPK78757.1 type II toxin-antitoxin system RelB/DinJ family antitoxin [Corynebacterium lizhenjunii]